MASIDEVLRYAYGIRGEAANLRSLIGKAKKKIDAGSSLVTVAKEMIGDHLDDMADARDKIAAARLAALRTHFLGPRPEYKVITEQEFKRQQEIARELLKCTDPMEALAICNDALIESMELIDKHDTWDVFADVEPLVDIATDAHEQTIAWLEKNKLRLPFLEFKVRQKRGLPHIAIEDMAKLPEQRMAVSEVATTSETSATVAAEAAPSVESSNPTADPT